MKRIGIAFLGLALLATVPALAQSQQDIDALKKLVPYSSLKAKVPGLTPQLYDQVVRQMVARDQPKYLGRLNRNRYDPESVANPYGRYGSRYSPDSVNNPYGNYGGRFGSQGITNPYATETPSLYGSDGKYLGKLSANPYDPDSVSNRFGRYGSRFSPDSIRNPFGKYGSPFSPNSATNPYTQDSPIILDNSSLADPIPTYGLPSLWDDQ